MGKPTGFIEYKREELKKEAISERIKHFNEFDAPFTNEEAKIQGARCMECGIPFCHGDTGCPVHNYIPEWNDLIYKNHWKEALENLHSTNNFPEFTGRLCPAPCETACTLGINDPAVSIKAIERTIIEKGFSESWVVPRMPLVLTGKNVAVVGSGPSGLTVAQQLVRAGHSVTVFEKNEKIGGLLRYGIPDFKMEKKIIDRRIKQMAIEGVEFRTNRFVGHDISAGELLEDFDAIVLAGGAEKPRDLSIPGRELRGIHFAMEYLTQQNKVNSGEEICERVNAENKSVVVIGGGDTGSDCVGTAIRQGAISVTQIELLPKPPTERPTNTPWPYWPATLRTSTSHEEGAIRKWAVNTKSFNGNAEGEVVSLSCSEIHLENGNIIDILDSSFEINADLVLIAAGFLHPVKEGLLEQLEKMGMEFDNRGNVKAGFGDAPNAHSTSLPGVFACGDMRRGQSLVVWAIAEGRKCASAVHEYLSL
jgi:glutamate synthase (NADPH/NADH) small chain